jgi:hypothetical protein
MTHRPETHETKSLMNHLLKESNNQEVGTLLLLAHKRLHMAVGQISPG